MIAILAVVAAAVPLAMIPKWFLYFDTAPKAALLLIACGCFLFSLPRLEPGLAALARLRYGGWYVVCVAAQIALLAISSAGSADRTVSFFGTAWRRLGALEYCAILLLGLMAAGLLSEGKPADWRKLFRVICLASAGIAVYGILQYAGWDPWVGRELYHAIIGPWAVVRPPGTLGHAVHLANHLAAIIFLCLAWAALEDSPAWKRWAYACACLAGMGLLLTGTRSGAAAALAGALLLLRCRPRWTKRRLITGGLLLLGLFAFFFSAAGGRLRDRTSQWARSDAAGGPRLRLWRDCLTMARHRPFLGYGGETFAGEFPRYQSAGLARAYPNSDHESPHNAILEALLSQGIAGAALLITFAALGIGATFSRRSGKAGPPVAAACLALFAGQQFAPWVLPTLLLFHLTVAMAVAGSGVTAPMPAPCRWAPRLRVLAIPAGALLIVAGVQVAVVDASWGTVRRRLIDRRPEAAMEDVRFVERLYPPQAGAELWYSRAILDATTNAPRGLRQRAWEQAHEAAVRAADSGEDRANALFNLAALFWIAGDLPNAETALDSTTDSAPHWYRPHWLRAELYLAEGRIGPARTEIDAALDLAGEEAPLMQDTVARIRARRPVQ